MTDHSKIDQKVLIVGAGPGGLVLAQILRQHGIPYQIFERSSSVTQKQQGWTVGLIESLPLLAKLLPKDLGDIGCTSVNYAIGEPDVVGILAAKSGTLIARLGGIPVGEEGAYLRVNREILRLYLSQHLEILTDKTFVRYETDTDGITAYFADGSSYRGSLLIGSDGAGSIVRKQLLGADHKASLSRMVPINGRVTLRRDDYNHLTKLGNAILFAAHEGVFVNIGLCSIEPDRSSAEFYWGVGIGCDDGGKYSEWVQSADAKALFDRCTELSADFGTWATDIIRRTGPEGIVMPPVRFLEYVPPPTLPTDTRVALLGDSAHTMIPFKGAGANTAMTDACDLSALIIREFGSRGNQLWDDPSGFIGEYNAKMLPRAYQTVLASRKAGESDAGTSGIMEGRKNTIILQDGP